MALRERLEVLHYMAGEYLIRGELQAARDAATQYALLRDSLLTSAELIAALGR